MKSVGRWRVFFYHGKAWTVVRRTGGASGDSGLLFRRGGESRFLAFSRSALPTDRELEAMSDEVLTVFRQRSALR